MKGKVVKAGTSGAIDLYAPSGIGDVYWLLMKLGDAATAEKKKIKIHVPGGDGPKFSRSKFLEFLPFVHSVTADGPQYNDLVKRAKQYERLESVMYCEANTWLESGRHIRDYMPAFPTRFKFEWPPGGVPDMPRGIKTIVVYASGKANNDSKSTGRWMSADWVTLVRKLQGLDGVRLVWIGASYDIDLLPLLKIPDAYVDAPAPFVLDLLRKADGFISFQSGLSCISVAEGLPTCMLYFRKIEKLVPGIAPGGGEYAPFFFDDMPFNAVTQWVKELKGKNV